MAESKSNHDGAPAKRGAKTDVSQVRRHTLGAAAACLGVALFATLPASAPSMAAGPAPLECDQLAGSPKDAQRKGPGVAFRLIDATPAIAACEKDLAAHPGEPRLKFDLARAREKAGDAAAAVKLYKDAADHQYTAAEIALAPYFWRGSGGMPRDLARAIHLLDLAEKAGDPQAKRQRETLYGDSLLGGSPDPETESFIRQAGDRGDALALYWLGVASFSDNSEALRLYKKASDLGGGRASQALGQKYCLGSSGLPKDLSQTKRFFDLAVKSDDAFALTLVGDAYRDGRCGMPQNDAEAARLYRMASDKGDPFGEYELGRFNDQGRGGLARNEPEAARLWSLAADDGDANAAFALGMYRLNGNGGMPKDEAEAVRLFKDAASHNLGEAKDQLSKMGIAK